MCSVIMYALLVTHYRMRSSLNEREHKRQHIETTAREYAASGPTYPSLYNSFRQFNFSPLPVPSEAALNQLKY